MAKVHLDLETTSTGSLRVGALRALVEHLESGHLALLPSDSAYTLTGKLSREVTWTIDRALDRQGLEVSLAFGSFRRLSSWVDLSQAALRLFGEFAPGAITMVAPASSAARAELARAYLFSPRTIGVRMTESPAETQIANELDAPLPTTPVRLGEEVAVTADSALAQLHLRSDDLPGHYRRLAVVRGAVPHPGRLSTVVIEHPDGNELVLYVKREAGISIGDIEAVARKSFYRVVAGEPPDSDRRSTK